MVNTIVVVIVVSKFAMVFTFRIGNREFGFDPSDPIDLSIPMVFNGPQPNAYGVIPAESRPYKTEGLIGDTRQGGSCNFEQYTFVPHCSGTHTEGIGHITNERISIRNCLRDVFVPSTLITVDPVAADLSNETYPADLNSKDMIISFSSIRDALIAQDGKLRGQKPDSDSAGGDKERAFNSGLIIRTLPNTKKKLDRKYGEYVPPFLSSEAIEYIAALGVSHLLVDVPSIDRIFDGGRLSNHRTFWNIDPGEFETNKHSRQDSTITELIYVPETVKDGNYLLNLQIASFESDAAPSRPLIFEIF